MKPFSNQLFKKWHSFIFFFSMCRSLRTTYEVNSLPKLIVVKDTGEIITKTGRKEVQDRGFIGYRNWRQAANLKEGGKLHSSAIIKSDRTVDPKDSDAWGTQTSIDLVRYLNNPDINNAGMDEFLVVFCVVCATFTIVPVQCYQLPVSWNLLY